MEFFGLFCGRMKGIQQGGRKGGREYEIANDSKKSKFISEGFECTLHRPDDIPSGSW